MKMHVLAAAVLATLASGAVLAASEGGDTWSELQPVQQSPGSIVMSVSVVASSDPALDTAAFEGSEGGDTWSRFALQFQTQPINSTALASGASD